MYREIKQKLYEMFMRIRCFVDGELYVERPLRGKSKSDVFSDKILKELETVMNREKFGYQDGKILLPNRYVVFISEEQNAEWTGRKREGLERKLMNYVGRQIRKVSSQATIMPHNYEVRVESCKDLQKDELKIVHLWEERQTDVNIRVNGNLYMKAGKNGKLSEQTTEFLPSNGATIEEITVIRPRAEQTIYVEIWRDGICQNTVPVQYAETTIGRGAPSVAVDVPLKGDADISRLHATLRKSENQKINLCVSGKKPVLVNGQSIFAGQTLSVATGEKMQIGSYSLCLRQ